MKTGQWNILHETVRLFYAETPEEITGPYHARQVASWVQQFRGTDLQVAVAWLHHVAEDPKKAKVVLHGLNLTFSEVHLIKQMARREESPQEYIDRVWCHGVLRKVILCDAIAEISDKLGQSDDLRIQRAAFVEHLRTVP